MQTRSKRYFELRDEPLESKVKRKIISAGGVVGETPATLSPKLRLVDDLQYNDQKYQQLCNLLKRLLQDEKPSASLKCSDVAASETVGDVIDLINKTISKN